MLEWSVINVVPTEDYKLRLTFANGEKRIFDGTKLFKFKTHKALKNLAIFMKAHIEYNTVIWSDELDVAPEYLYENSVPLENQVD